MRRWIALLLIAPLLAGCARQYVMTLTNGTQIGTKGKPRLKGNYYEFKDALGRESRIGAGRVVEVAPASMVKQSSTTFNPTPTK